MPLSFAPSPTARLGMQCVVDYGHTAIPAVRKANLAAVPPYPLYRRWVPGGSRSREGQKKKTGKALCPPALSEASRAMHERLLSPFPLPLEWEREERSFC